MGLDFSHGGASWSYSGFNRFRERLMQHAGLGELRDRVGFGGDVPFTEDHPLIPLLDHSDCDGELSVDECLMAAPALVEAITHMESDQRDPDHEYDRRMGLRLAAGMLLAASERKPLEFC